MKLFIVAALLVASVAGQSSLDILKFGKDPTTMMTRTRSSLKFDRPVYPMPYTTPERMNMYPEVMDTTNIYGDDYYMNNNILSMEEMMVHPRFQEYMRLPLFRQYWSTGMFQRYVCSMYFQRFWEIPSFKMYFVQPALFYKYIYPCVQLFKYQYDTTSSSMNTYPFGEMIWNKNYYNYGFNYDNNNNNMYYSQYQYPTVCRYNAMYCKAVVENLYEHLYNTMMRMPQEEEMMMPSTYNYDSMMYNPIMAKIMYGYYNRQYPTVYNRRFPSQNYYETEMNMNKMFENTRRIDDFTTTIPTTTASDIKFETIRPVMNKMPIGMKTFDEKVAMPEQIIKA